MKRFLTLLTFLVLTLFTVAQCVITGDCNQVVTGIPLRVCTETPSSISICEEEKTLTINLRNPSNSFAHSNIQATIHMQPGVSYVEGSASGATEFDMSDLSSAIFTIPDLGTDNCYTFTVNYKVNCDFFSNPPGTSFQHQIDFESVAGSIPSTSSHITATYSIQEAALSIINVDNQVYSAQVGDNFSRCLTVTNQGQGYLTSFSVFEDYGSDIRINSIDKGFLNTITPVQNEYVFGATEIQSIGDGDIYFEIGESFEFCQDLDVTGCSDVNSSYQVDWTCEGQSCQVFQTGGRENSNVIFPNTTPIIDEVVSTRTNIICLDGEVMNNKLKLVNNGSGDAQNLILHLYTSRSNSATNTNYYNNLNTVFDTSAITLTVGGLPVTATIDSIYVNNGFVTNCNSNVKGIVLTIPFLASGDTLDLDFDTQYCDLDGCIREYFGGWAYKFSYQSLCNDFYNVGPFQGDQVSYVSWDVKNDYSPSNWTDGMVDTVLYTSQHFGFSGFPSTPISRWKIKFNKNSCFTLNGPVSVLDDDGANVWLPYQTTQFADSVVAYFSNPRPSGFNPFNGNISVVYQANCANCPTDTIDLSTEPPCSRPGGASASNIVRQSVASLGVEVSFIPDTSCSKEFLLGCDSYSAEVDCPGCDSGLIVTDYRFERFNVGNPDENNDGVPDNIGKANKSRVRLDLGTYHDSIINEVKGVMDFPGGSKWNLCYVRANFTQSRDLLKYLSASVIVKRGGTIYNCNAISIPELLDSTDQSGTYLFDISADKLILSGCLPPGFLFEDGDSIHFTSFYRVENNPTTLATTHPNYGNFHGNEVQRIIDGRVAMHVNDSVESTRECHRFYCNSYLMNLSILPIRFYGYSTPPLHSTRSCDSITFTVSQHASYGKYLTYPCQNPFENEHRNFGYIDTMYVEVPVGFEYVRATYYEHHLGADPGVCNGNTGNVSINPVNSDTTIYAFPLGNLRRNNILSEPSETYYGYLGVTIKPTCETPRDNEVRTTVRYSWYAEFSDTAFNSIAEPTRFRDFRYDAPQMQITANDNIDKLAFDDTVSWKILVSNDALQSNGENVWIGDFDESTGVDIIRVHNLTDGGQLIGTNGVYEIGQVQAQNSKEVMVVASFSNCSIDSLILAIGWDCPGYIDSVSAYECTPELLRLTVDPQLPDIQSTITLVEDSLQLCDTAEYVIKIRNVKFGTGYDFHMLGVLPSGVTYIPGSSFYNYIYPGGYVSLPDPLISGGTLDWDLTSGVNFFNTNGFHGIPVGVPLNHPPGEDSLEIRMKVLTDCDYVSGSTFGFFTEVVANCGDTITSNVSASTPLIIEDAIPPYYTYSKVDLFEITPCSDNALVTVTVVNNGPASYWVTDSVSIELPDNIFYEGNYTGILNSPTGSSNISTGVTGREIVSWALPTGVGVGDTIRFSFETQGSPDDITCSDIPFFDLKTVASSATTCNSTGLACDIKVITGESSSDATILKVRPALANLSATSIISSGAIGETVTIDLDVINGGYKMKSGYTSDFNVYQDVDNNNAFDRAIDTLVATYTASDSLNGIGTNPIENSTHFNFSVTVDPGQACGIFIEIDSLSNTCFCNSDVLFTTVVLDLELTDSVTCTDLPIPIGIDSVNGYTYAWNPSTHLDDGAKSHPVFTKNNVSTSIDSIAYVLTVDRMGCTAVDTMLVQVYPLPVVNAGPDEEYCETTGIILQANVNEFFETSIWDELSNTTGNSSTIINPLDPQSQLLLSGYGTITYELSKDNSYCPVQRDTVVFTNYEQSVSSVSDIFLCNTNTTTLNGTALPTEPSLTTRWVAETGSPITFTDSSIVLADANNIPNGENFIYLESQNGVCPVHIDTMEINNVVPHQAILPSDTSLCEETSIIISGNALDTANFERGMWFVDGNYNPATLSIQDDSVATISGLTYGEHRVVWGITSDYCDTSFDTIVVMVYQQPVASALPLYLCDIDSAVLIGNMSPAQSIPTWTKSTNSTIQFQDSNSITTSINFINYGTSEIYLKVQNGVCPIAYDTVEVINLIPHQAILPPDSLICEPANLIIEGNTPEVLNFERGVWHLDSSSGNLGINILTVNDSMAQISGLVYGENSIVWEIQSDYCQSHFDTMRIIVYETPQAFVMNDTGVCQENTIPIRSSFYPSNATDHYWIADQTYPQPNVPTLANYQVLNPTNNQPNTLSDLQSMIIGSYRLIWHVGNGVCPTDTASMLVYNYPQPNANYFHTSPVICVNECVEFSNRSDVLAPDQIIAYSWYSDSILVSNDEVPTICFDSSGNREIKLVVETNNGCFDSITTPNDITVNPNPQAGFSYAPVECIKVDEMIQITDESIDALVYEYNWGDGTIFSNSAPNHYYSDTGIYLLEQIVTNGFNCTDSTGYYLYVGIQNTVYIPNAFSPDGNGVNEVFKPEAYGIEDYELKVFDRWGDLIFQNTNIDQGWDGKRSNGKPLKQDVYIWTITYREICSDDEVQQVLRGHVTLIK